MEKKLIQRIHELDLPSEKIFNFQGIDHEKEENAKRYYFSLILPVKPFHTNLKPLIVNIKSDLILPCYQYPVKFYNS